MRLYLDLCFTDKSQNYRLIKKQLALEDQRLSEVSSQEPDRRVKTRIRLELNHKPTRSANHKHQSAVGLPPSKPSKMVCTSTPILCSASLIPPAFCLDRVSCIEILLEKLTASA